MLSFSFLVLNQVAQTLHPPPVALQGVATPLSWLCPQFPACSRGVAATPPPKNPVAVILALSQVFGPPKPCHAPGGGAATLASVALHVDTKVLKMCLSLQKS